MRSLYFLLASFFIHKSQQATITVDVAHPSHDVSPTLFGQFFEEINHAGVGGLYGELLQNRAFEDGSKGKDQASISPVSQPSLYIRHYNYTGYVSPITDGVPQQDATFNIVPSFYNPVDTTIVSFEASNYPDYYFRHYNFVLSIVSTGTWASPDATFQQDASFRPVKGLSGGDTTSFQSVNYPDHYIAISTSCSAPDGVPRPCFDLILSNSSSAADASFNIRRPPLATPSAAPWTAVGQASIILDASNTLNSASTHSLRIDVPNNPSSPSGVSNNGYWGIPLQSAATYYLTFYARSSGITSVNALLQNSGGTVSYSSVTITGITSSWKQFTATLVSNTTDTTAKFSLVTSQSGQLWLDVVSLFPAATWKTRRGGLRNDLANFVANLKPKFLRFPGGCYVEGVTLDTRFNWKNALNNIEDRPGHWNHNWNYWSEDGLGLYEYLQFIEDIGAEAIWVVNVGISHTQEVTSDHLQSYLQDALDSLEFAMGSNTSTWGSIRAKMGHSAPFKISFIAVGNEENIGGPSDAPYYGMRTNYMSNYKLFYQTLKGAYPDIPLIANADMTNWYGQSAPTDVFDFHIYSDPQWFFDNIHQWDSYSRSGPKVFVSEYAVTSDCGQGNLAAAVAEAAYMTGLERNSDIVILASYAPLFVNVNDRTWNPDLIVFNNHQVYGTASYWVQQLFSNNADVGAKVLPVTNDGTTLAVSATLAPNTKEVVIKLVNYGSSTVSTTLTLNGTTSVGTSGTWTVLTSGSLNDENSFDTPDKISPKASTISVSRSFTINLVANSVNVLRYPAN